MTCAASVILVKTHGCIAGMLKELIMMAGAALEIDRWSKGLPIQVSLKVFQLHTGRLASNRSHA